MSFKGLSIVSSGGHFVQWSRMILAVFTGWERTVHMSCCAALYSGRIFVPLGQELMVFVILNNQMWEF